MSIGERVRTARKALRLSQEAVARRAGVSLNQVNRLERGEIIDPHFSTLSGLATALDMQISELVGEPTVPLAEVPSRASKESVSASIESIRRVSARVEDAQRALLEAERLRETARPRVEEALAALARVDEALVRVDEAQAALREQEAHLQEVRRVMDQVYGSELELGWAYGKAMMEEGSPEGQRARRLRLASRKMVLFYEELVDLIRDAGVQVKRQDEGKAVEEPKAPVRPEALELTVH